MDMIVALNQTIMGFNTTLNTTIKVNSVYAMAL